ncbi:L-lactate permease [Peribacillus simplex]|uniref:L-lactate permease n=1 Tax=Peribacillus simplex TaxID=1478 RepID=A0AAW7IE94_9BACI|nr:L-lactate permease [Peribacillus simplex]AMM93532.1 lactate permease [Peribacillus simplex]MDM5294280.1 L-lactate permease [Peribacillus simplex]MDM5453233.1 L-lactate permease [Peribacillus simplex]
MNLIIALLPFISIFVLLFVFKQTSLRSGLLSYIVTLLIILVYPSYHITVESTLHASFKGFLISFVAAYVLFFGILFFHLINNTGGIRAIASFLSEVTTDQILQVILLVIGLSPLLESTSGFGIAFMIVAPILIALGFSPMKAASIGLVSLLAVPWGALSTGTVIGAQIGGIPLQELGTGTAIISIPVFIYFLLIAVYLAGGKDAIKYRWKEILLLSVIFSISIFLFNAFVSVELAGVLSSLVTSSIGLLVIKIKNSSSLKMINETVIETSVSENNGTNLNIIKVMSPYLILTLLIFISRLIPSIKKFLESHFVIELPSFSFSLALLYSPGFWLFITCLYTIFIFKISKSIIWSSLKISIKQWVPFVISTTAFVAISQLMTTANMTFAIANAAGLIFGSMFIFVSPFIGGIGGFLTGSNTGSNAMFTQLQVETAKKTGLPLNLIASIQNTSSSHSTMASPSRIMLGASLCRIESEENRLLKKMSIIVLGAILLIIILTVGFLVFDFWF